MKTCASPLQLPDVLLIHLSSHTLNLESCWKNLLAVLGCWSVRCPNDLRDIPCFTRPAAHSTRSPFLPRNKSGSRLHMEKLLHQLLCLHDSQGKAQFPPHTSLPWHRDPSHEAWCPHVSSKAPRSPLCPHMDVSTAHREQRVLVGHSMTPALSTHAPAAALSSQHFPTFI